MFACIMETISYPYMRRAPFRKIVKNILQFFPSVNLFLMHLCEKGSILHNDEKQAKAKLPLFYAKQCHRIWKTNICISYEGRIPYASDSFYVGIEIHRCDPAAVFHCITGDRTATSIQAEASPILHGLTGHHGLKKTDRCSVGYNNDSIRGRSDHVLKERQNPVPQFTVRFCVREIPMIRIKSDSSGRRIRPIPLPFFAVSHSGIYFPQFFPNNRNCQSPGSFPSSSSVRKIICRSGFSRIFRSRCTRCRAFS